MPTGFLNFSCAAQNIVGKSGRRGIMDSVGIIAFSRYGRKESGKSAFTMGILGHGKIVIVYLIGEICFLKYIDYF
jgi:hypothetical protein